MIKYYFFKFFSKISNKREILNNHFRRNGIKMGKKCYICANLDLCGKESHLIQIGDNVTFSSGVKLLTHDASFSKIGDKHKSLFGKIIIGNNCFIGENSLILYGVTLADNIIVGAGSVVCNSFSDEKIVIAGNPAIKICTWDDLKNKYYGLEMYLSETHKKEFADKFIKRKIKQ